MQFCLLLRLLVLFLSCFPPCIPSCSFCYPSSYLPCLLFLFLVFPFTLFACFSSRVHPYRPQGVAWRVLDLASFFPSFLLASSLHLEFFPSRLLLSFLLLPCFIFVSPSCLCFFLASMLRILCVRLPFLLPPYLLLLLFIPYLLFLASFLASASLLSLLFLISSSPVSCLFLVSFLPPHYLLFASSSLPFRLLLASFLPLPYLLFASFSHPPRLSFLRNETMTRRGV